MFTSTMTYEEIYKKINEEIIEVQNHYQKVLEPKVNRELKKASKFPKRITHEWRHPKSQNLYIHYIQSNYRSQWDNPFRTVLCEYEGKDGKELLCIHPNPDRNGFVLNIFRSHFFKRYRERVLKEDVDYYQTIAIYIMRNSKVMYLGKDYVSYKEQQIELPGFSQESMLSFDGLGLGLKNHTGNIVIYKTFVGIDQLHDDQLIKVWLEHLTFFFAIAIDHSPKYKKAIDNLLIELAENIHRILITDDLSISKEEKYNLIFQEYDKIYTKLEPYIMY